VVDFQEMQATAFLCRVLPAGTKGALFVCQFHIKNIVFDNFLKLFETVCISTEHLFVPN
jgi:hypothetical protein